LGNRNTNIPKLVTKTEETKAAPVAINKMWQNWGKDGDKEY
jgi:hypothetical protein